MDGTHDIYISYNYSIFFIVLNIFVSFLSVLVQGGKLLDGIFKGGTINTPSMICVEDYLDALNWVDKIGGNYASDTVPVPVVLFCV